MSPTTALDLDINKAEKSLFFRLGPVNIARFSEIFGECVADSVRMTRAGIHNGPTNIFDVVRHLCTKLYINMDISEHNRYNIMNYATAIALSCNSLYLTLKKLQETDKTNDWTEAVHLAGQIAAHVRSTHPGDRLGIILSPDYPAVFNIPCVLVCTDPVQGLVDARFFEQ